MREGNAISSGSGLLLGLWHSTRKQDSPKNHEEQHTYRACIKLRSVNEYKTFALTDC